jgi:hypothetical protein
MLDDDGDESDPTPSVGEEEREARDEPTASDEEFLDDSEVPRKDKTKSVSAAADKKKKRKKELNIDEVKHMYRKLLAKQKKRAPRN